MIGGRTDGHVSENLNKIFNIFLTLPNCAIKCKVAGKRINQGAGYVLEIPLQYNFFGTKKSCGLGCERRKKVIDRKKKELTIVPSNNLRENI